MVMRFFNAYGPGEHYSSYRSVVCLFAYRMLKKLPIDVYEGYYRAFQYIDDLVLTLSSIPQTFQAGETINIAGDEYRSVEDLYNVLRDEIDYPIDLATLLPQEAHNVRCKHPSTTRAKLVLGHQARVGLEEGVKRTVNWMRETYR
jgi:dTDP-glucose 4,6-dehydratase